MLWIVRWLILFGAHAQDVRDLSDRFAPPGWQGNPWGPAAARARAEGRLPAIVMTPEMTRWDRWGRAVLRDGDIVFRMGDSRTLPASSRSAGSSPTPAAVGSPTRGSSPSRTARRSSTTAPSRASAGQPFAVWTLDNVGAFGVKRLKAERRKAIPGVLAYCRKVFEQEVPFDYSFDLDDSALYCLEMTEKAFRSQGLALSEPVRLGDMENATRYPICIGLFVSLSPLVLKKPLTLEQAVYMPGNGRHGMWASPLLEPVYPPPADRTIRDVPRQDGRFSLGGDLAIVAGIVNEFRTSDRLRSQREARFGLGSPVSRDAVVSASPPTASARSPRGIGVLGDSYSDEYQFSSPDRRTARNWVEILSLTRGLDFGRFNASGWGSPRDRGFEYNWAHVGATTGDLIATGQHTGLAAQVARGDVGTVFVFIGGNDFINAMSEPDPEAALREALPRALANYRLAVGTIRAADPDVRLVLATVPDIRLLPEFAGPFREGRLPVRLADACTAALGRYNAQIRAMAAGDRRVALLDLALVARLADLVSRDYAVVGGEEAGSVPPRQLPGSLLPGRPPAPGDPGKCRTGPGVHLRGQCPIRRRDRAAPRRRGPPAGRRSAGGAGRLVAFVAGRTRRPPRSGRARAGGSPRARPRYGEFAAVMAASSPTVGRTKPAEIRALVIGIPFGPDQDSPLHEGVVGRVATWRKSPSPGGPSPPPETLDAGNESRGSWNLITGALDKGGVN